MLRAHEAPISIMEEVDKVTDFSYALVHLFEQYPDYFEFFKKVIRDGRIVYLDNSIFELGTAFSADRYAYWIEQLRPQYYVVPDVLEDANSTIANFENWLNNYSSQVPGQRIGVVQGSSYEDIVTCYRYMAANADMIAISFNYGLYEQLAPSTNIYTSWMLGRVIVLNRLLKDGIIIRTKRHHLLGCSNPNEFLFYRDVNYNWIYSLDTSVPVVHGLFEQSHENGIDILNWRKESTKLFDLINVEVSPAALRTVLYNIEAFKRLVP